MKLQSKSVILQKACTHWCTEMGSVPIHCDICRVRTLPPIEAWWRRGNTFTSHRYGPGSSPGCCLGLTLSSCGMSFTLHSQCLVVFPLGFSSTLRRAGNCSNWNRLIRLTGLVRTCSWWCNFNGFTFSPYKSSAPWYMHIHTSEGCSSGWRSCLQMWTVTLITFHFEIIIKVWFLQGQGGQSVSHTYHKDACCVTFNGMCVE